MLRIITSYDANQAKSYYTDSLNRGDYYRDGQEMPGFWGGELAEILGLAGEVSQQEFFALADNVHPATGEQLTPRMAAGRRVGYDINFHVPKSVSILYSVGQDDRILYAFRDSVTQTMSEIEAKMNTRVRVNGAMTDRSTGNAVWATFVHATARPVKGVPDPHLHAHAFTFNITHDAVENRFKAGEFSEIKTAAPLFQARFLLNMASRMRELGYDIVSKGNSWEVAGISERLTKEFSRRTSEINKLAKDMGVDNDPERKANLGARTREKKKKGHTISELREDWKERAGEHGWEEIKSTFDKSKSKKRGTPEPDDRSESRTGPAPAAPDKAGREAVEFAIAHVFERKSAVPERELLQEAFKQGFATTSLSSIGAALRLTPLIRRQFGGKTWVTTQHVLADEEKMISFATNTRGKCNRIYDGVYELKDQKLNDGQQAAIRHVLNSYDQVMLIRGGAGTGKTSLMREAIDAITQEGMKVAVLSPLSNVARQTLPKEGFPNAETIAGFLRSDDMQKKHKGGVLWIDEAGLLAVKTVNELFSVAKKLGCRLVLSGDDGQHKPVERGDGIRLLVEEGGMQYAEVNEVVRQTGEYKTACEHLNRGEISSGWNLLDKMGSIIEIPGEDGIAGCHRALAREFAMLRASGKSVQAIAPTHAEGRLVTSEIRSELRQRRFIGKNEREFEQLKPLQYTVAQKLDADNYKAGLVIQFHDNSRGKKGGGRGEVVGVVGDNVLITGPLGKAVPLLLKIKDAEKFSVHDKSSVNFAVGDTIRFTNNGRAKGDLLGFIPDRSNPLRSPMQLVREIAKPLGFNVKHVHPNPKRLNNGSVYTIKGFIPLSGDIILNNGYVVDRNYGHFTHAYCSTSPDSQSKTYDHSLVSQTSMSFGMASNKEQFLVSATRGRWGCTFFTDDKERLSQEIMKASTRMSATELISRSEEELRQAVREQAARQNREKAQREASKEEGRDYDR